MFMVAAVAAVTSTVLVLSNSKAPKLAVGVATLAVVAALLGMLAVPLPTGSAIGAMPDGRYFEIEIPSYRTWGSYLAVTAAAATLLGAAVFARHPHGPNPDHH